MRNYEEKIYEKYRDSGFKFNYSKGRLGRSKTIFRDELENIQLSKRNQDNVPLFVYCRACEEYMDFKAGPKGILDGLWICPYCRVKVRERTPYNQLERENQSYLKNISDDEEDYF